jgi:lysylphosphatidylglycerol synthetase-like protein (DUF2156 family)
MSWPYFHTLVNHFPIVLTVIGALAVLAAAMIERRAVWIYALSTLVLAGLTIYPAWLTGGRASDVVRKAWYIAPGAIHAHSSAADITVWIVGVTGLLALIALITLARVREAIVPAKGFRVLVGVGALASICAVGYTGYLGGKIVVESPILMSPTPPVLPASVATPATTPTSTQSPASPASANPAQLTTPQTQTQLQAPPQGQPHTQQQSQPQTQPQTQPKPATQQITVPVTGSGPMRGSPAP